MVSPFVRLIIAIIVVGAGVLCASSLAQGPNAVSFGPNVIIFNPSMPTSQIQAAVDAISTQQVSNQLDRKSVV